MVILVVNKGDGAEGWGPWLREARAKDNSQASQTTLKNKELFRAKGPACAKAGAAVCWSQRKSRPNPLTDSLAVALSLGTGDCLPSNLIDPLNIHLQRKPPSHLPPDSRGLAVPTIPSTPKLGSGRIPGQEKEENSRNYGSAYVCQSSHM